MARKTCYERTLTVFSEILISKWPMFLLYHPVGYRVKGEDIRDLLDCIRPGDILMRGYDQYLDGKVIPGYFSHVGLYLGDITQADVDGIAHAAQGKRLPGGTPRVSPGKCMVIHALAEGVLTEDVINFCRCDYMAVLRMPAAITATVPDWKPVIDLGTFEERERVLYQRLRAGERASFEEVFPLIRDAALGKLGTPYDFKFDFERMDRLSCSELIYFATKAVGSFLGISPVNRRFLLFFQRSIIEPDAFVRSPLEVAWKSRSIDAARFEALRPQPTMVSVAR